MCGAGNHSDSLPSTWLPQSSCGPYDNSVGITSVTRAGDVLTEYTLLRSKSRVAAQSCSPPLPKETRMSEPDKHNPTGIEST